MLLILAARAAVAQLVTVKGIVTDAEGERLPLATVWVRPDSAVTSADEHGEFSLRIHRGRKQIVISYTGFEGLSRDVLLLQDSSFTFILSRKVSQLREVTVTAGRHSSEDLVQSTRTGTTTLTQKDINAIPVLGGEADLIKTLQLLPGAVRGVEGSSDIFVRGGAADQNLVLLDGAPIYNTSHLFGFLSVFNPSILDHVESINGGFPAEFGGRLSSILNISSSADIAARTSVSGDIGIIATRFYVEQPLIKDKASFWLAGRRTYIDKVVKAIGEDLPYFFYDLNGKAILQPGRRNTFAQVTYTFSDSPVKNYYMINVQEVERKDLVENLLNPRAFTSLFTDEEFNGQSYGERFRVFPRDYKPGDSIAVSLSNISEEYYRFMQMRIDNRFSFVEFVSEPVNYPSNVVGGKGFFNLYLPDVRFFVLE